MDVDLVVETDGDRIPVAVTAEPGATVADLRRALSELGLAYPALFRDDGTTLDDPAPLATSGLHSGAVVRTTPSARPGRRASDGPQIAIAGGLHCGSWRPLSAHRAVTAGRSSDADLNVPDPEVSRRHLSVNTNAGAVTVTDLGSANGTRHGEFRLTSPLALAFDPGFDPGEHLVAAGETRLAIRQRYRVLAESAAGPDGVRLVNRPPRIIPPGRVPELAVPTEPVPRKGFRFPWLATLAPAVVCGALYLVLPAGGYGVYLLLMMALSPLLAVANLISDRRSGRREYATARASYESAYREFQEALTAAAAAEERACRSAQPDPTEVLLSTFGPAASLWQRRRADPDFLALRLGLHDRPARLVLRAVELTAAHVLGVAGPRPMVLAAGRALLMQAAVLHSPAELGIVVLTGRDTAADWDWLTWLPHTLPGSAGPECARLVATDAAQAEARLTELARIADERTAQRRFSLAEAPPPGRTWLVVLDGSRRLRDVAGLADVLARGPAAGIYAVCLDADETALPDECGATMVASNPAGSRATLRRRGLLPAEDVLVDGLDASATAEAARALAPLRPLGERGTEAVIPDRVRLLEMTGGSTDPAAVRAGWDASPGGRCTRAVLGIGESGPVVVDLRRDGPHALIAGTSGAGKSELLQTLVASLALANRPDALSFVLVDYKGGSAFAACADLPHCVGLITDLDGHLVRRALDSLTAELRRRERLFAEAGANDIDDYWARTDARLPRLVIVVDEFASLVEELPEFVPGVVGIGMRGRSLGVHVVLATQRPGGVVTADLRANVNLRICLRVTSTAESQDVIDAPDAARIPHRRPGRAYLRTGHSELTEFQAARVGWPRARRTEQPRVTARVRRIEDLGEPAASTSEREEPGGPTDLTDLVAAIRQAADGLAPPARPWLAPLPEIVPLAGLSYVPTATGAAVIGLVDRPADQAQEPFVLDLDRTGCVAIAGTVRSGRSTALRTLAAGLCSSTSPADLHLYALDCGNQALACLVALPHCGAVVAGDDDARTERLLALLHAEVGQRQRAFAAAGHASLAEHRAAADEPARRPYVVLLLDRAEAFLSRYAELDGGRLVDRLEALLRTGPAVGITVVLGTDRTGFGHRIASAVSSRLVLRQATVDDAVAFGLDPRGLPRQQGPGRAIWAQTGDELQIALLDADPSGAAQAGAIERLGATLHARWDGLTGARLARRVDPLPEQMPARTAEALRRSPRGAGAGVCTPAVGGDLLAPVDLDLIDLGGTFIVSGPPRSGRSTALAAIVSSLAGRVDRTLSVLVVAPRRSPLRDLDGLDGVTGVLTGDASEIAGAMSDAAVLGAVAVVIDDAELLSDHRLNDVLEASVRDARDAGSIVIAAATTDDLLANPYRGWLATARRTRSGLLLNPASHVDGEVFGVRLPRSTSGGWPPGRALLVRRGEAVPVQVVQPETITAGVGA
jgi:S-DNA-T family DNA segregation ATPase FtsK/SpoIIIE